MQRQKRYAGKAFDFSSRQSIEVVGYPRDAREIRVDEEFLHVRNIYHCDQFWQAKIPLNHVQHIYGQGFNFSKPKTRKGDNGDEIIYREDGSPLPSIRMLNHVQSRIVFDPAAPIELRPLDGNESDPPVHRIHDLVYSLEAVGPLGVNFNLRDAMSGALISAHRFMSTEQMVFERIVVEGMYVFETAPLPLDAVQKRRLLELSLLRSHRAGLTEEYYLYRCCGTNNCTSNPLQLLDRVAQYGFWRRLGASLYRLPLRPRFYLQIRGMDADPKHRKLVRQEFREFIADAETQRRKREHVRARLKVLREAKVKASRPSAGTR